MKQTKEKVLEAKKVATNTVETIGNNLPTPEIEDNTTTKGKVSTKFNLNNLAEAEAEVEKLDKNKVFNEVNDFFCPVKFDSSTLENALSPLVLSGIMSEDAKTAAIEKAKREFLEEHKTEIEASNNLSFAEVVERLQTNKELYKKVLSVCNISEIRESDYIRDCKVQIYRASQCQDKDGKDRYKDVTLKSEFNGKVFTQSLFVEYRDITTQNVILSIRYAQSRMDANKRLFNQINDYKRILTTVFEVTKKAKENGFTYSQVFEVIRDVFGKEAK